MKQKTQSQSQYYPEAKVTCVCGNSFTTGSTQKTIKVDICSACHPFFTGQMKYIDSGGRVKRFEERMKQAQENKKREEKERKKASADTTTQTLKEMLKGAK